MSRHLALTLLAALCSCASAAKVLVLYDDPLVRSTHSRYFAGLQSQGHTVTVKSATDGSLKLKDWDDWMYEKLILFAPSATGFGGDVDSALILEFIESGHDVVIAADPQLSEPVRELCESIGVDLEGKGTALVDHVDHVVSGGSGHTTVLAGGLTSSDAILGGFKSKAPVLYRGIAGSLSPDNTLGTVILSARDTAFSTVPGKGVLETPSLAGGHAALVTGIQARNGARAVISGSLDLFSNTLFSARANTSQGERVDRTGNAEFCAEVTKWAFHERGVLRVSNERHNHAGSSEQPDWYRVSDDLEFALDIHEFSEGSWKPYRADDVQVEFIMLDPYQRINLRHNDEGHYFTSFKVPDTYGVYKFVVSYHRDGYTTLDVVKRVSVRPFRHNEFERFLTAAYPYYASVISTMAAFFVFSLVFLYHK